MATTAFDLLRAPLIGALLRRRGARVALRAGMLLVAVALVLQGLFGSRMAPKNPATVLTWVHFRGALVVVLLLAGNFFCATCPFVLARDLARRFHRPALRWPRALRNKWPGVALLVAFLFCYELFDLWNSPFWTAMVVVFYFGAVLVVDGLFQQASFCKYVCPIGQFNFAASTLSPLEVKVRDVAACDTCATRDCIKGTPDGAQRGCELALFQPRKVGNLDCTFCLDCVDACPKDNVGIVLRMPGEELADRRNRSGLGRLHKRPDLAALAALFTFGALLNAFGMVSPVYAVESWLSRALGVRAEWPALGVLFALALVVEPVALLGLAAAWTRWSTGSREKLVPIVLRHSFALVPLGFGIWLSHYLFHFLTGLLTFVPVVQSAFADAGIPWLGDPDWTLGGLPKAAVYPLELGFIALGVLVSLGVAWRLAAEDRPQRPAPGFIPWAFLCLLLGATALWLLSQPMEMRATFLPG
ncbi:MAG TPA: 4Fe-4S binding protein [Myxococcales bacterium]|nr:4Fe-4S binding protein [Myxococcales bacterium]